MRLREFLESLNEGMILIEYQPSDHPERAFLEILTFFKEKGVTPVVVDIKDSLQVFVQQLKLQGFKIKVDDLKVIKEGGRATVGELLGKIDEFEDFTHHIGKYWEVYKKISSEERKTLIILGLHKFLNQIKPDITKIEAYFEVIGRRHLQESGRVAFLFLNIGASSKYFRKGLEEIADCVLRVDKYQNVLVR
ncbi:DUF257 family protein [Pyrococcus kukulkanii]|nr:DUF257 family protein [Pyrococcus kukulkanii]AMM54468.1 hypothetical protein TQ32_08235 [Pyrococcus kukulkanii]